MNDERTPTDGKPYYCKVCGMGFDEFLACEEPDCALEGEADALARAPLPDDFDEDELMERVLKIHRSASGFVRQQIECSIDLELPPHMAMLALYNVVRFEVMANMDGGIIDRTDIKASKAAFMELASQQKHRVWVVDRDGLTEVEPNAADVEYAHRLYGLRKDGTLGPGDE